MWRSSKHAVNDASTGTMHAVCCGLEASMVCEESTLMKGVAGTEGQDGEQGGPDLTPTHLGSL